MIELHQFKPLPGLPNASPFCMKVETYLRLTGLDYKHVTMIDPSKAPKGKAPFIRDGQTTLSDSHFIIAYLKEKHGDPLGEGLSAEQRAHNHALARMCEDHLLYSTLYFRWIQPDNARKVCDIFFGHLPGLMRTIVFKVVQRQQRRLLHAQGTSRHTEAEMARLAGEDIDALATVLDDSPYFGGDRAREIDCTVFPFLANILYEAFDMPPKDRANSHANLVTYRDRMMSELFSEVSFVS